MPNPFFQVILTCLQVISGLFSREVGGLGGGCHLRHASEAMTWHVKAGMTLK